MLGTFVIRVSSRSIINHTFNIVGSLIRRSKNFENFIKEIIRSRYDWVVCIMTMYISMRVLLVLDILGESKIINDLRISLFTLWWVAYVHKNTLQVKKVSHSWKFCSTAFTIQASHGYKWNIQYPHGVVFLYSVAQMYNV